MSHSIDSAFIETLNCYHFYILTLYSNECVHIYQEHHVKTSSKAHSLMLSHITRVYIYLRQPASQPRHPPITRIWYCSIHHHAAARAYTDEVADLAIFLYQFMRGRSCPQNISMMLPWAAQLPSSHTQPNIFYWENQADVKERGCIGVVHKINKIYLQYERRKTSVSKVRLPYSSSIIINIYIYTIWKYIYIYIYLKRQTYSYT